MDNRAQQELAKLQQLQAATDQSYAGLGFIGDPFGLSAKKDKIRRAREQEAAGAQQVVRSGDALSLMNLITDKQVPMSMEQGQNMQQALSSTDPNIQAAAMTALQSMDPKQRLITPMQQMQMETEALRQDNQRMQIEKLERDLELSELTGQATIFNQEGALRDDAAAALKTTVEFQQNEQQLRQLLMSGNAMAAQASLVKMAKILDPTSVAREGEVEVIRQGSGLMSALQNSLNQAVGQGMGTDAVAQFNDTLDRLVAPERARGNRIVQGFVDQAQKNNIDPAYALATSGIDMDWLAGGAPPMSPGNKGVIIDLTGGQ